MTNLRNTKRALLSSVVALFICFSMLLGTTFAWFTDSVTSQGNIIQSGTLKVGLYWVEGNEAVPAVGDAAWKDASGEEAIFNNKLWEPGYVEAKHILITNEGTLALDYKLRIVANGIVSDLADVIDVYYFADATQLTRANATTGVHLGTLAEVLGATAWVDNDGDDVVDEDEYVKKTLDQTVYGTLEAKKDESFTLAFVMDTEADNKYQGLSIGADFTIELIATQASVEPDSFGPNYDEKVPSHELPAAYVTALKNLDINVGKNSDYGDIDGNFTLDAGYQFEPTQTYEQAQKSAYRYWHADFVVYADSSVPANSLALAGYYKAFCDLANGGNWVALASDQTVEAGTEVRLVKSMAEDSIYVNWELLCQYGNDGKGFQCGVVDLTGANAGTTITVELRLYETTGDWSTANGPKNEETGEFITVGTFKYTFPVKESTNGNIVVVKNATELQAALNNAAAYETTFINFANDIIGDVVVDQPGNADVNIVINGCGYKYDGTITVKGNSDFDGKEDDSLVIKNVNFETSTAKEEFIWSVDSSNGSTTRYAHNVSVEHCTFTANGDAIHNAVAVHFQQAYNINVVNCTATNMHTLLQAESCGTDSVIISVDGCTVVNGKNAVSFNNTYNAVIKNSNLESVVEGGYGIRHKGSQNGYSLTVENCTVKAFVPVLIRDMTGTNYVANFNGENTLTATNDFGYQVVLSANDWDNDSAAPTAPTGSYTLSGADAFVKNVNN